ncbi:MAG: threonine aldolase family protein [Acidimicrobiia bacterium]
MSFSDGIADFRSDTVTRPTPAMRRAMAEAVVGDDVYGEDPTVNALEDEVAELLGKPGGVFVPTGTMGNQIALNVHTRPGDEVLCVAGAHVRNYERGAASAWSGVAFRTVDVADGVMMPADVTAAVADDHLPPVRAMVWENTHNLSGGTVVPIDVMEATSTRARSDGLRIHLDGARLWNASVATGVSPARYAAAADTVMCCFSKGLGAPVGSILCGDAGFVAHAREVRKRLGGGMRQVGVLAAAAHVALGGRERVAEDHALAARLGAELAQRLPAAVTADRVATNMVMVDEGGLPCPGARLQEMLARVGVLVGFMRPGLLRFCTHRDVDDADVDRVVAVTDELAG